MPEQHSCPLCTDAYDDRRNLRVHLEVEHRKSEIVSEFIDLCDGADAPLDDDVPAAETERPTPSAD